MFGQSGIVINLGRKDALGLTWLTWLTTVDTRVLRHYNKLTKLSIMACYNRLWRIIGGNYEGCYIWSKGT